MSKKKLYVKKKEECFFTYKQYHESKGGHHNFAKCQQKKMSAKKKSTMKARVDTIISPNVSTHTTVKKGIAHEKKSTSLSPVFTTSAKPCDVHMYAEEDRCICVRKRMHASRYMRRRTRI